MKIGKVRYGAKVRKGNEDLLAEGQKNNSGGAAKKLDFCRNASVCEILSRRPFNKKIFFNI